MYKSDLEIAQQAKMLKISEIAKKLNLSDDDYSPYGHYKAKINLDVMDKLKSNKDGKVILVTAINPTPAGEGKSTTTVGLGQAFNKLNKNTIIALREPSFGPVLGVKGGAAGGGYSQVVPMEDINLHFTGDIHAITTANNAVSALLDNHLHQGNKLNIDPNRILWKRCLDMNDRSLRQITIGLGGPTNGVTREDGFNISVASEIMAVLCLSSDMTDLKNRLKRIVLAYNYQKEPVTLGQLGIEGSIALILSDALKPNLVQTLENTPAIIHGGPFANIAHGCNSIIATNMARKLSDYVITEAGFGADLGAEKFLNIKTRQANFKPSAVVVVATIRALKMHGGVDKKDLVTENIDALLKGISNLEKHIENITKFNLPYVVAINKFHTDTDKELSALHKWAKDNNHPVELSDVWAKGGEGALDLANTLINIIDKTDGQDTFTHLYDINDSIESKISTICKEVYGATTINFTPSVKRQIKNYTKLGYDKLSICMAKTQYSLSDNPKALGRPENFEITVRELRISNGAGFIVALTGDVMTMPGLPKVPSANAMDIDKDGNAVGLF